MSDKTENNNNNNNINNMNDNTDGSSDRGTKNATDEARRFKGDKSNLHLLSISDLAKRIRKEMAAIASGEYTIESALAVFDEQSSSSCEDSNSTQSSIDSKIQKNVSPNGGAKEGEGGPKEEDIKPPAK